MYINGKRKHNEVVPLDIFDTIYIVSFKIVFLGSSIAVSRDAHADIELYSETINDICSEKNAVIFGGLVKECRGLRSAVFSDEQQHIPYIPRGIYGICESVNVRRIQ